MSTHAELRKEMEDYLVKLKERMERIDKHLRHPDEPLPSDWEEQAQALENEEVVEALDEHVGTEIVAIEAALKRMDDGEYGNCGICDEPIAEKRLEAIPWATTCINHAE